MTLSISQNSSFEYGTGESNTVRKCRVSLPFKKDMKLVSHHCEIVIVKHWLTFCYNLASLISYLGL